MKVKIFLPVSREAHLARLFASLEMLECDPTSTSLFVYVDGPADLYVKTRNYTEQSKFSERLCVQRPLDKNRVLNFDLYMRRVRIAKIQNEAKQYLADSEYIFGVEDDTIVPPHALKRLLLDYGIYPYAGFISGVELGRWGIPYVGAWRTDDVYEPTRLETIPKLAGTQGLVAIEQIDAGGFYCYLTKTMNFMRYEHAPFDDNNFGPDVAYGIALRREGLHNYLDWSIRCEHRTVTGEAVTLVNTQPRQIVMTKKDNRWRQEILSA